MLCVTNIDRNDAAINTKAPFEYSCPLRLAGGELLPTSFIAIKVYCSQDILPPVRLSSAKVSGGIAGGVYISFEDSNNVKVGGCTLRNTASRSNVLVTDDCGVITGHLTYRNSAVTALYTAALQSGGEFNADPGDFVLLPQCHVSRVTAGTRCITANGINYTGNVCVGVNSNIKTYINNGSALALGVYNTYQDPMTGDGITKLSVNGVDYDVTGGHVVLRNSLYSNIRITADSGLIRLSGVKDV